MSLSFRDRVELGVYPDRVVLARAKGSDTVAVSPAAGGPGWRAAVDAVARLEALGRAEVTVVLSSFFVRYSLVPLNAALTSAAERLALARHCLSRIHGNAVEGWMVRLSGEVACGVDAALVHALRDALGKRLRSLQPHLMASFNRSRGRLGASGWFVDVEPGLASVALVANGAWQSLRSLRVGAQWKEELPGLLAREACFVDSPADCPQVVHAFP